MHNILKNSSKHVLKNIRSVSYYAEVLNLMKMNKEIAKKYRKILRDTITFHEDQISHHRKEIEGTKSALKQLHRIKQEAERNRCKNHYRNKE